MFKASIRISAIDKHGLRLAELHGKRLDETSQERKINDIPPLVYGSLDLEEAYEKHTFQAKKNAKAKKVVSHALIQFPIDIAATPENHQKMMDLAKEFINSRHGGNAVFAMRLDRDELGVNKVDVFYTPLYEKITKTGKNMGLHSSLTKFPKEHCYKYREEITRRCSKGFNTGPRACGISMQNEFRSFLAEHGFQLSEKKEKNRKEADWENPNDYKIKKLLEQNAKLQKRLDGILKILTDPRQIKIIFLNKSAKAALTILLKGFYTKQDKNLKIMKDDFENQKSFRR